MKQNQTIKLNYIKSYQINLGIEIRTKEQREQIINHLKLYWNILNIIKTSNKSNITKWETIWRKSCETY